MTKLKQSLCHMNEAVTLEGRVWLQVIGTAEAQRCGSFAYYSLEVLTLHGNDLILFWAKEPF